MALRKLSQEEVSQLEERHLRNGERGTSRSFLERFQSGLDTFFGGGVIGEAIGTQLAKKGFTGLTPEQRKEVSIGPTKKQIAGDILKTGALFTPVGRIAGTVGKATIGLGKASKIISPSIAGATAGLGLDVGEALRKEEPIKPIATVIGGGLPATLKTSSFLLRKFGLLVSELAGVSTGAGGKTIQEFFDAIRAGGERAEQATRSLRGKVSEDLIVKEAKLGLDKVVQRRTANFVKKFQQIINNKQSLDISPITTKVTEMIEKFRIKKTPEGLDFFQSPLKFNKQAQNEISTIVEEMETFGKEADDLTPLGVDTLKRALDDLFSESSQARAFTAAIRKEVRRVLSKVDGYDKMEKEYAESTEFIKELSRTFSLNDRASIDTTLKKLISSLRQQQGFRDELIKQLDEETGQFITAQIAGQLLKEVLPTGILRAFGPLGAGIAGLSLGILPMLQALAIMSPRIVGEFVRALGISVREANILVDSIMKTIPKGARSPGDVLLNTRAGQALQRSLKNPGLTIEDVSLKDKEAVPQTAFKGFKDLTTKFLEHIKGKQFVSKQEVLEFARRPELKKGEADLLLKKLEEFEPSIEKNVQKGLGSSPELLKFQQKRLPAQEFADSIKRDLLPLKPVKVKDPQFRRITIPEELSKKTIAERGLRDTYEEVVFESPIVTNGSSHYPNSKNYFAHARGDEVVEGGKKIWREQEIQSDFFEKIQGRLANELGLSERLQFLKELSKNGKINEAQAKELQSIHEKINAKFQKDFPDLFPFAGDRFGERNLRERIKEKALKGYDKYRIPTGKTIGKIEGFEAGNWFKKTGERALPENVNVGDRILMEGRDPFIVTKKLPNGQIRAIDETSFPDTKSLYDGTEFTGDDMEIKKVIESDVENFSETIDLTGRSNPQYIRYEKWGKFLKNKFGGREVTDPQGNTWVEVDLTKALGRLPVEAFSVLPFINSGKSEND